MSEIKGINHFALSVADLEESCIFYEKVLKLEVLEKRANDIFLQVGENSIMGLLQYPGGKESFNQDFRPSKIGKGFTHFGFEAESEEEVFSMEKHLISHNVPIIKPAYKRWDGASVYFLDPNNYTLEFLYYKK